MSCMLINTEKEHGRPPVRKSECDFPAIGKSQFPLKATLSSISKGEPPFPEKSFDVIWSEAAIHNVGFEHGLRLWKPLLRAGGYIVVSEVVWLTQQPPQMASEFWNSDYPSMTTVDVNLATLREVGFGAVDHFVLSSSEWQNYYGPLQEHVTAYRSNHAENSAAQALADSLQNEIDMWKECGDSFGYCFFIGRAN
ncbi:hypothetical protein [uncultured Rubinisphaera sp.]|uniref:hypothetical protein n=1 Tax=uncultured Rubinisphaera sp. TaxID=1678686 RepID=UPI0030DD1CE6